MCVLFVCTANSCRSQMAEGWAHHLYPSDWGIHSAGLITYPISRRTKAVMKEVGIDLTEHHSKSIDEVDLETFDVVVTLSEEAGSYLPQLAAGAQHWRRPITDPMGAKGTPDEVREAFRTGREETRRIVESVLAEFAADEPSTD